MPKVLTEANIPILIKFILLMIKNLKTIQPLITQ